MRSRGGKAKQIESSDQMSFAVLKDKGFTSTFKGHIIHMLNRRGKSYLLIDPEDHNLGDIRKKNGGKVVYYRSGSQLNLAVDSLNAQWSGKEELTVIRASIIDRGMAGAEDKSQDKTFDKNAKFLLKDFENFSRKVKKTKVKLSDEPMCYPPMVDLLSTNATKGSITVWGHKFDVQGSLAKRVHMVLKSKLGDIYYLSNFKSNLMKAAREI